MKAKLLVHIASQDFRAEKIREFHCRGGGDDKENALVMKRSNTYLTVSMTGVEQKTHGSEMVYKDLINKTTTICNIEF